MIKKHYVWRQIFMRWKNISFTKNLGTSHMDEAVVSSVRMCKMMDIFMPDCHIILKMLYNKAQ